MSTVLSLTGGWGSGGHRGASGDAERVEQPGDFEHPLHGGARVLDGEAASPLLELVAHPQELADGRRVDEAELARVDGHLGSVARRSSEDGLSELSAVV